MSAYVEHTLVTVLYLLQLLVKLLFSLYRKEKSLEVSFECPQLCQSSQGMWHHVVIVIQAKGLRGKSKATLFLDGKPMGLPQKVRKYNQLDCKVLYIIQIC